MKPLQIGNVILQPEKLFLIAGPCVIESRDQIFTTAEKLKNISDRLNIPWIFKSSFDKANRSSIESYRGPGMDEGLKLLQAVRKEFDVPVLTDIHTPDQAEPVAEVVDAIQIPAFLCRQTDLLVAASKTGKPVNVKKAQFMSAEDMKYSTDKILNSGNKNILVTERGTSFGYHNLVVDMRGLAIMKKMGYPVIFDATHSVQRPAGLGNMSGGDREFIPILARSAAAAGIDGLFMEVHSEPENAKCDAACQWPLAEAEKLLTQLIQIHEIVKDG